MAIYVSIASIILVYEHVYVDRFHRKLIYILAAIIFSALLNLFLNFRVADYNISYWDILRDIWYFSRPVFVLLIGYNLGKKALSEDLLKVVIFVGLASAIFHYYQIIQFGSLNIFEGKREYVLMNSSYVEALLLSILIIRFVNYDKIKFRNKFLDNPLVLLSITTFLTPSVVLYLSRTMIVVILAILFFGLELYKINFKSVSIGIVALIGIVYISAAESTENPFLGKIQRSATEVGLGVGSYEDRLDENSINAVWRGYEAYRAVTQLLENNRLVWFFGEGLGSKVDLKIQKELAQQEFRFIPKIHNGYVLILFKSGIIGLLLYFFLMYQVTIGVSKLSFMPVKNREFYIDIAQGIGLTILLASVVVGGIYNGGISGMTMLFSALIGSLKYDGPYIAYEQKEFY